MFAWSPALDSYSMLIRGQGTPPASQPVVEKKLFSVAAEAITAGSTPRAAVAEWIARGSGDGSPADEADLFVLVGSLKAGVKLVESIVDRWFARYGARGAIEIVTQVGGWVPSATFPTSMLLDPVLPRVRAHLAHAADYDAARDWIAGYPERAVLPAWPASGDKYNRSCEMLAFLFPDQRSLFAEALANLKEKNYPATYLLAAVQSPAELASLTTGIAYQSWDAHAVTLAYALKDAALEPLVEYTQRSRSVVGVARALTAFVSETAATALAQYIETKPAAAILETYFKTHRALAKQVLGPLSTSKKKAVREKAASWLDGQ